MEEKRTAVLAGAGFAGLTLAAELTRRGWSVQLHEQNETLREFGAGILLWRNAMAGLEQIGVAERIRNDGLQPLTYDTVLDGELVSSELEGFPYWAIPRPHLHRYLVDAAREFGVEIVTGSRAVRADPEGVLVTESGEAIKADLVVGTDGAGSAVRNSITDFEQERKRYRDGVARVLVPRPESLRGPEWDRVIDHWTRTTGPDVMRILFIPCGPDLLYMGMMAETANDRASRLPIDVEVWSERFPHLAEAIELAGVAEGSRHDSYQTNKLSRWSVGRVALVGDSANAMCPALGEGASVAIVNAVDLAAALDEHSDVETALSTWESRQRFLTDLTQEISGNMAESRTMAVGSGFTNDVRWIASYIAQGIPGEIAERYPVPEVLAATPPTTA